MYTAVTNSGRLLDVGSQIATPHLAILVEVNGKLTDLIERSHVLISRQRSFVDRVVGCVPESSGQVGNKPQEPAGLANSITEKLSMIDGLLNELSAQTARMEIIA